MFLVVVYKEISSENGQIWPFMLQLNTRLGVGVLRLSVELHLGESEPKFIEHFGPPKRSSAPPRRTSLPRRSIAPPRRTCKSYFGSSLPLILTVFHWTNKNPNK